MAYTTTFTCDCCGKQAVDQQKFLTEVCVQIRSAYDTHSWDQARIRSAFWCKECLLKNGISWPHKYENPPVVPPTLEEVIRKIVRDEIGASA